MSGASAAARSGWGGGDGSAAEDPRSDHVMSIGEVLAHLRADFPDTTISKLRFLESEGLVEPRRTPAGYRKYTWSDVSRLRFVLTAQRDHYLPLRVIREHLAAFDDGTVQASAQAQQGGGSSAIGHAHGSAPNPGHAPAPESGPVSGSGSAHGFGPGVVRGVGAAHPSGSASARGAASAHGASFGPDGVQRLRPSLAAVGGTPAAGTAESATELGEIRLTRAELLSRASIDEALLAALEQQGLIAAQAGGWYDADGLEIAVSAAQLAEYGFEPRHLRAYRVAADREIGLFTQLVAPIARQSGPAARARASEAVRELAALTQRIQAALVRAGLRETLGR